MLTFLTPLRTEHLYARRGAESAMVVRTGMGPARSRAAARKLAASRGDDLGLAVVLGVAGGLQVGQSAGDVVVASQVAEARDGIVTEPWTNMLGAEAIASMLAGEGFRAIAAGLVSSAGVVWGDAARRSLAEGGARAVDMESWWLVDELTRTGVPVAVVRVLLDCPGAALASAGSVVRLPRTYRVLTRVAAALERHAADVRAAMGLEPHGAARFAN